MRDEGVDECERDDDEVSCETNPSRASPVELNIGKPHEVSGPVTSAMLRYSPLYFVTFKFVRNLAFGPCVLQTRNRSGCLLSK